MVSNNLVISPHEIGQYTKNNQSKKYIKLENHGEKEEEARSWRESFKPLNPALSREGLQFEEKVYEKIRGKSKRSIENWKDPSKNREAQDENNKKIREAIEEKYLEGDEKPIALMQAKLSGDIGNFFVPGDADLITIDKEEEKVSIKIIDIKSSWEEKTHHQIQVACYSILLKQIINNFDNFDIKTEITGGVIHKNSEIDSIKPKELPEFLLSPREGDVKRILGESSLKKAFKTKLEDIDYNIENLKNSSFAESVLVRSIEEKHIRLLGLSIAEQRAFQSIGLTTIDDVADLIPKVGNTRPYEYDQIEIEPEYKEKVRILREEKGIEIDFIEKAQKAQALLARINPKHPKAYSKSSNMWISGSGESVLPRDDNDYIDYEKNSLIKIFMNIQKDYIKDSLSMVSYRIECGKTDKTIENSLIINDIHDEEKEHRKQEKELVERSSKKLINDISKMGDIIDRDKINTHFYLYTNTEKENYIEALERHKEESEEANILVNILGMRKEIEQKMVSIIKKDITKRIATRQFIDGLLPIHNEEMFIEKERRISWEYERNEKTIDIKDAFKNQLFNYNVPYENKNKRIFFQLDNIDDPDGWYPLLPRFGSEIPIEYIWGTKEIDKLDKDWTDNNRWKALIESYKWIDRRNKEERISKKDVKKLGKKFCKMMANVEDSIGFKNTNIDKKPLEKEELFSSRLDSRSFEKTLKDYLKMEYNTSYSTVKEHYKQDIKNRILTGESIPLRVIDYDLEGKVMEAECEMIYSEIGFKNPKRVARSSKVQQSEGSTSGSYMIMSPINRENSEYVDELDPERMFNSPIASIETMDPERQIIKIKCYPNSSKKKDEFESWHKSWSDDDDLEYYEEKIENGKEFILDPCSDDLNKERSKQALDVSDKNKLFKIIKELKKNNNVKTNQFNKKYVSKFVNWIENNVKLSPNKKQKEFIKKTDSKVSLLQGPPGTGKTSGALSLNIISRVFAKEKQDEVFKGLVSGASNKSINEVMEDVMEWKDKIENKNGIDIGDLEIYRITSNKPEDRINGVNYMNTHDDDLEGIKNRILETSYQSELGEESEQNRHVLVFSTPSNIYNLTKEIGPGKGYEQGVLSNQFNMLSIDEASMMTIPQLILAGSQISEESQILLSGDQRQMPPVQRKEWQEEKRPNITREAPFLSALDYFRFLKGEKIEKVENVQNNYSADIPITRLRKTYRCHTKVAKFLKNWIYYKDDINYNSDRTELIGKKDYNTEFLDHTLEPQNNIVLILHNDKSSQQNNINESVACSEIIDNRPSEESIGVVTPHNSQKGLLKSMCSGDAQIDTVERFQGGQKSIMILSTTVSDFNYIQKESDFILNPERLNVALSRMKKKLIVMAPRNIFKAIPDDTRKYNRSVIWKGLYEELNVAKQKPDYKGNFEEINGEADDVDYEIYTL